MSIKQVIVMRKDLNMRKGKMCAQAAHASMKTALSTMHNFEYCEPDKSYEHRWGHKTIKWYKVPLLKLAFNIIKWFTEIPINDRFIYKMYDSNQSYIGQWLGGIFTKVVVGVDSDTELYKINKDVYKYNQLMGLCPGDDSYVPCELIVDSGATEFNGVPTLTCLAIGPAPANIIDKFTGHLKLL